MQMLKSKLAEAASEHIKHRIVDGYEDDVKRRADYLDFLNKMVDFGQKLQKDESK